MEKTTIIFVWKYGIDYEKSIPMLQCEADEDAIAAIRQALLSAKHSVEYTEDICVCFDMMNRSIRCIVQAVELPLPDKTHALNAALKLKLNALAAAKSWGLFNEVVRLVLEISDCLMADGDWKVVLNNFFKLN